MLESMSGVSFREFRLGGIDLAVHARSVNHRFLDLHIRSPEILRSHRIDERLTELARSLLVRGRVDIELSIVSGNRGLLRPGIDHGVLDEYTAIAKRTAKVDRLPAQAIASLLALPGVSNLESILPDSFRPERVQSECKKAIELLVRARRSEGRAIAKLVKAHLREIDVLAKQIKRRQRLHRQEKMRELKDEWLRNWEDVVKTTERGMSEAAILDWMDRSNITEELDRLALHAAAMRKLVADRSGRDADKRLDYFSQELLRECNTIGSKSRDAEIRSLVVDMKAAIENIKEQVRNVC